MAVVLHKNPPHLNFSHIPAAFWSFVLEFWCALKMPGAESMLA